MRLMVDLNRCEGYAQCAFLAPDVFTMHGEEALLYEANPDDDERERVDRAAAACPVQAIIVEPETPRIPEQYATRVETAAAEAPKEPKEPKEAKEAKEKERVGRHAQ